jgi:3',5'-cyclic AMP phosphodiesterase CpdA
LTSFRILHLSDFHWSSKSDPDQKQIVTGLLKDIPSLIAEKKVDLLVFSGDLVFSGKNSGDFERAKQLLLDPVRDACSLTDREIVICPGIPNDISLGSKPSRYNFGHKLHCYQHGKP